jgi:hypothetical protein
MALVWHGWRFRSSLEELKLYPNRALMAGNGPAAAGQLRSALTGFAVWTIIYTRQEEQDMRNHAHLCVGALCRRKRF